MSMPVGMKETSAADELISRNWGVAPIAGWVLRQLFITSLVVLVARLGMPETETFWRAYESPNDLLRVILGLAVCAWLARQLFHRPKDAQACRVWFYVGLVAVPFVLVCTVYLW